MEDSILECLKASRFFLLPDTSSKYLARNPQRTKGKWIEGPVVSCCPKVEETSFLTKLCHFAHPLGGEGQNGRASLVPFVFRPCGKDRKMLFGRLNPRRISDRPRRRTKIPPLPPALPRPGNQCVQHGLGISHVVDYWLLTEGPEPMLDVGRFMQTAKSFLTSWPMPKAKIFSFQGLHQCVEILQGLSSRPGEM